jgi:hypothetical protein
LKRNKIMSIRAKKEIFFGVLLIFVLAGWLSFLEATKPNFFLFGDNSSYFLPSYINNWRAVVEEKTIPLITWHQFLGQTYLGQGQNSVLYPPVYGAVFLSKVLFGNVYSTIDILVISHLLVAAVGMYFLLRRLKISTIVSFLGSLVWITAPFIIGLTKEWVNISYAVAYLPLNFLLLEKLVAKPRMRYVWGLAFLKMFMSLQGYVQWVLLLTEFEVLYVALTVFWHLRKQGKDVVKEFLRKYVLSFVILFFLVAPLFFPMLYAQQMSRHRSVHIPFLYFMGGAMDAMTFLKAQVFMFASRVYYGWGSYIYFVGPISLLLLLLASSRKVMTELRRKRMNTYVVMSLVALLLCTPLSMWLYFIPVLSLFKGPPKYFLFFGFFLVISVAGIIRALTKQTRKRNIYVLYVLLLLTVALNMLIVWQSRADRVYTVTQGEPESSEYVKIDINRWVLDNPPKIGVIDYIEKRNGRVFSYGINDSEKILVYNFATMFGLYHFGGYDTLASRLNGYLSLDPIYFNSYIKDFTPTLLDYLSVWSVRYIITTDTEEHYDALGGYPQLKETYREDGVLMYENTRSRPFVYESDAVEETVPFEFGVNHIDAYPKKEEAHRLTFSIAPLPLFYYYFDGERAGRVTSQDGPVEVNVPAGTKKVTIRYVDYPFIVGVSLFVVFWVGVAGYWIRRRVRCSN